jgi:hypothetical protein
MNKNLKREQDDEKERKKEKKKKKKKKKYGDAYAKLGESQFYFCIRVIWPILVACQVIAIFFFICCIFFWFFSPNPLPSSTSFRQLFTGHSFF